MDTNKVNELCEKIKNLKISLAAAETELKDATQGMTFCRTCGKYLSEEDIMVGCYKEVERGALVYQGCGYGDDDKFADVTYLITVYRCPYCGGELKKRKLFDSEENRHSRYQ